MAVPTLKQLHIEVGTRQSELQLGVDESYSLEISAGKAVLQAKTVFGSMHGLKTFAQLVQNNGDCEQAGCIRNTPLSVTDAPRFPHRGLMLDTSRHYYPLRTLERIVDGVAATKMNTLHWHIVDAESFPLQVPEMPRLTEAAYGADQQYSSELIRQLVQYAKERGVRVVPEVDVPGHSLSWGKGYPDLLLDCAPKGRRHEVDVATLDPTKEATYKAVSKVFDTVRSAFPDKVMHIGGDEVSTDCWHSQEVRQWMRQHNMNNVEDLMGHFAHKVHTDMSLEKDTPHRVPTAWEEHMRFFSAPDGLPEMERPVVQVWSDRHKLPTALRLGFRALLSQPWYLDHENEGWQQMYSADPLSGLALDAERQKRLLGGEACMWSERVDDRNVDQTLWPRAAAVAERLWSAADTRDLGSAEQRLKLLRLRLRNMGIHSSPLQGPVVVRQHIEACMYCPETGI